MPELADYPHLRNKLLPTLAGTLGHFLYGDVEVCIREEPPVDGPEASFT
jgi:prophage DNA circulation protein